MNQEQQEEIKLLKAEVDLLKKELAENRKGDNKRHKEIKELQQQQHQDNLFWNKVGALATPLTLLLPLIAYFFKTKQKSNKELEKKLDKIIRLLEEQKKTNHNEPKLI